MDVNYVQDYFNHYRQHMNISKGVPLTGKF